VLDQADPDKGNPAWRNKVRVLQRGPGLKNPSIHGDVQSAVYDALLRNRKLDVVYLPRGADKSKQYEIHPLGLDATPAVMIKELKTEVEVKQGGVSKPIGFIG